MTDMQNDRERDEFRAQLETAAARSRPPESKRTSGSKTRMADETARLERDDLDTWAPPSMLTLPPNDDYWVYRWVSEYVNGSFMTQRLNAAKRDGYEFVRIDELPEGFIVDEDMKGDGIARVGGLIMARMPRRKAELRKAYYERRSAEMLSGANQLQGIAGKDSFEENRGTRALDGRAAGEALRRMAQ
jgi:hypothetical protein